MTGLEVKSCENCPYNKPDMDGDICSNCEEAVKQEVVVEIDEGLKSLENIKKVKVDKDGPFSATFLGHDKRYCNDLFIIEKELEEGEKNKQILEVLANKGIDYRYFKKCKTVEDYNEPIILYGLLDIKAYTQEEFNLLKRWLEK